MGQRASHEGCRELGSADARTALRRKQGWVLSADAGLTWSGLVLSSDASAVSVASAPSPAGPPVLFAGTSQGAIYAAGPGVGAVAGNLRCAVEPTLGFGRVWSADAAVRETFGCPRESERPTQLLEAVSDGRRHWWFADGLGPTLVLEPGGRASVDVPVAVITPQPQRTLPAVVQRYAGGTMVWREEPGQRLITLVDETQRRWTEVPD